MSAAAAQAPPPREIDQDRARELVGDVARELEGLGSSGGRFGVEIRFAYVREKDFDVRPRGEALPQALGEGGVDLEGGHARPRRRERRREGAPARADLEDELPRAGPERRGDMLRHGGGREKILPEALFGPRELFFDGGHHMPLFPAPGWM